MKKKLKKESGLNSLRLQIGALINDADEAGLHNSPYQIYNVSQSKRKNKIIQQFNVIENKLVACMQFQEKAFLFLENMLNKFSNDNIPVSSEDILELILNTDVTLMEKDAPFNEIVSYALDLLSKKIVDAKNTLLDVYYIYKTIELEGIRLGWLGSASIACQIIGYIDKYFEINPCYATSQEYYLLKQIADEKNFDNAYYLYYHNLDLLLDVTFIKVNYGIEGTFIPVDLYRPFAMVENIAENLYSPFYGGKVNFVSGMVTQRIKNMSMTQRNVSLDVNTLSYIRTMADGHIDKLPSDHIKHLISNIDVIRNVSSFDYMPYILENYVFAPENEERILNTVQSVEHFFYPNDPGRCLQYYETVKNSFKEKATLNQIKRDYYIGYALLLLICFINFKFCKMKTLQKLENFCSYMDTMFFLFREPFVEIAFNFFEHGNQYRFFKKIQKNAKNILKDLRNMAWDVFHLWCLEATCSTEDKRADLFVPYFYCFDKGLLELKECFDLEALFVNKRTKERVCFYHKHSYPIDIIEKYKTIEREKIRRDNYSHENIMMQIEYLEKQIISLW